MYFLIDEEQRKTGPYDLVSLIKKARNHHLSPNMLLEDTENPMGETITAQSHPTLREIFEELKTLPEPEEAVIATQRRYQLVFLVKQGVETLLSSQSLLLYASVFVLLCAAPLSSMIWLKLALPLKFTASLFCMMAGILSLSFCLMAHLRQHRGQPVEAELLLQAMKEHRGALFKVAAIMGILTAIGLWFLVIPGIFILLFTIYAPLLITDQKQSVANALVLSRKRVQQLGWDNIGVIFGLIAINVVLAPLVFPLVFTLPITLSGLVTIYDEQMF